MWDAVRHPWWYVQDCRVRVRVRVCVGARRGGMKLVMGRARMHAHAMGGGTHGGMYHSGAL